MRKAKWAALTAASVLALTLLTGCSQKSTQLRIGTGGTGGIYHSYGQVLSGLAQEAIPGRTPEVRSTAGSAANLRLLSDQHLELAISQTDVAYEAYYGVGLFAGKPCKGYSAVASLYPEPCQIVVRADSDIHCVDDLLGKRVSIGEEESGVRYNAVSILKACGLSDNMLETEALSYTDAAQALESGTIDAFFCTAGVPTNAVAHLSQEVPVRLLPLSDRQLERLLTAYHAYTPIRIPANTYPGQEDEVLTVGVRAMLVAGDQVSQQEVYDLLSTLYADPEAVQLGTAANTELVLEEAALGITIPVHPGAARFFDENNIVMEEG